MTWNRSAPEAMTELEKKELSAACVAMPKLPPYDLFMEAKHKALAYCAKLSKELVRCVIETERATSRLPNRNLLQSFDSRTIVR